MANQVLRNVMKDLESVKFLTLMADETTDISSRKQLVICLRYIDDQFVPHEIFVGVYTVDDIKADTIISAITDTLTRFNIPFNKLRVQCSDMVASMAGSKNGVAAKQILEKEGRAVYTHCYGHAELGML